MNLHEFNHPGEGDDVQNDFNPLKYPELSVFWIQNQATIKRLTTALDSITKLKNTFNRNVIASVDELNLKNCINQNELALESLSDNITNMIAQLKQCDSQLEMLFRYAPTVTKNSQNAYERQQLQGNDAFQQQFGVTIPSLPKKQKRLFFD